MQDDDSVAKGAGMFAVATESAVFLNV